jgi:hypothetical protein
MSKTKCPCCGKKTEDSLIKEVSIFDLKEDSVIISKPEGMSDKVWDRIVRGYSLNKIIGTIQTCDLRNSIEQKLVTFFLKNKEGLIDDPKEFLSNLGIEPTEENTKILYNLDKKLIPNGNIMRMFWE